MRILKNRFTSKTTTNLSFLERPGAQLIYARNREKFIRILENQIERIGSEQNFLITHNDMFSSYPIDVIDLNFDDSYENNKINSYELANIIHIVRK